MSVWRKKAYELFGFRPGAYSYAQGKRDLFRDLVKLARESIQDDDTVQLSRIVEFVRWASDQNADELASSVDLAFFLPVFRDPELRNHFEKVFPADLFSEKFTLLMEKGDGV